MSKHNEIQDGNTDAYEGSEGEAAKEAPQIYHVKRDLAGWKFSRREFVVAAAAATTAAATMAATGRHSKKRSLEPALQTTTSLEKAISLAVVMPAVMAVKPGETFTQLWLFTNNNKATWCRNAGLRLVDSERFQAPGSISVPDIAPGKSVEVAVPMVAPAELAACRGNWQLRASDNVVPVSYGSFVIQNGCIAESAHPYTNDMNNTWTVNNPDTGAAYTRLHFARLDVEPNYDMVILKDSSGQECQRITGNYPSGLWSNPIPGNRVQVQLITDATDTRWGWCVDQIETTQVVYIPLALKSFSQSGVAPPTATPIPTKTPIPCSCDTVCSCVGNVCACDTVCTCDTVCSCDGHCICDTVCSCVGDCSCDTYCSCDTVCSCVGDCSCDTYCSCDTVCSCVGDYCSCVSDSHYWYPN